MMRINVFRKIFQLCLEYIGGFVMALVTSAILSLLLAGIILFISMLIGLPGCYGVGFIVLGILFINIPLGGMLGIVLVDRYLLKVVVSARQIIFGILMAIFASLCLLLLYFLGVPVFYLLPYDGLNGMFGGFGLFFIVCMISLLLGYHIGRKTRTINGNKTRK